jgi:hypothetical protein
VASAGSILSVASAGSILSFFGVGSILSFFHYRHVLNQQILAAVLPILMARLL